jgi:acetoin utilization deacetylase AcuC-like enzyme
LCASSSSADWARTSRCSSRASASEAELQLFHTPEYLQFVMERSQAGSGWLDAGDTPAFRGVFEAAPAWSARA